MILRWQSGTHSEQVGGKLRCAARQQLRSSACLEFLRQNFLNDYFVVGSWPLFTV